LETSTVRPAASIATVSEGGIGVGSDHRICEATGADDLSRTVRRNTLLLAAVTAVNSVVLQLGSAVSSLTFVLVTEDRDLLGLGPAIFLISSGLTAVVAGQAMDRYGRRPVLAAGFVAASAGCALTALATDPGRLWARCWARRCSPRCSRTARSIRAR
jgi:Sugar (and other) transporter